MKILWPVVGLLLAGCVRSVPPPVLPAMSSQTRLAQADALVRDGCLDCLIAARDRYAALRTDPAVGAIAAAAEIKTLVVIALREDTLGLLPGPWLDDANAGAAASPDADDLRAFIDFGRAFIVGAASGRDALTTDADVASRFRFTQTEGPRVAAALRSRIPGDLHAAVLWFELACTSALRELPGRDERLDIVADAANTPLLQYRRAIGCPGPERSRAERLLATDPRFVELNYQLALSDLAGRLRPGENVVRPDLDSAVARLETARVWRPKWPALLMVIGNTALTAEDFIAALRAYDDALASVPNHPSALLGRLRTLTYLGRSADAIAVADTLLSINRTPGDALYWRAYNRTQLEQHDQAWDDVERAERLLVNADVPKLAGIIAINRRDYPTARARLELAVSRRSSGCDAQFYLQAVLAELRDWNAAAQGSAAAAACLDGEIAQLGDEIARLRTEAETDPRQARLVPRREAQLEGDQRMRGTTRFNAAVANFNLQRVAEARSFALLVLDDPRFADRARELIARIDTPK